MSINKKLPAEKYIKRNIAMVPFVVRIPKMLKQKAEDKAKDHGSSLNRIVEAAIEWYIIELK